MGNTKEKTPKAYS